MIRRGFWLVAGAAGGIMGYRRVSSIGRQVSQTLGTRQDNGQKRPSRAKRHWARETLRFTRDVRDGMDMYIARQQRPQAPSLGAGNGAGTRISRRAGHNSHDSHDKREDR